VIRVDGNSDARATTGNQQENRAEVKPDTITADIHQDLAEISAEVGTSLARFPDFLIAGPQRTGSTWFFQHLDSHPEIYLPGGKETYYFSTLQQPDSKHYRFANLESYLTSMQDSKWRWIRKSSRCLVNCGQFYTPRFIGDATASNATLSSSIIREIAALNPDIKVIVVLRPPLERAWSHAKKDILDRFDRGAEEVPEEDFRRFFRATGQMERSRYSAILANWRSSLKPGNLLLVEFRRIKEAPRELIDEVLRFLGTERGGEVLPSKHFRSPVNPTREHHQPEQIQRWLIDAYAELTIDYEVTLQQLEEQKIAEGCYCT